MQARGALSRVPKEDWTARAGRSGLAIHVRDAGLDEKLLVALKGLKTHLELDEKLEGAVIGEGVWLRAGEYQRLTNSSKVSDGANKAMARVGLALFLTKGWQEAAAGGVELGGEFVWGSPVSFVAAQHNVGVLYPGGGLPRGFNLVERSGESLKHLHLSVMFTTKNKVKAMAFEQSVRQMPVRATDTPGVAVDGRTGEHAPL